MHLTISLRWNLKKTVLKYTWGKIKQSSRRSPPTSASITVLVIVNTKSSPVSLVHTYLVSFSKAFVSIEIFKVIVYIQVLNE